MADDRAASLRSQAAQCLRLAKWVSDPRTIEILKRTAEDFQAEAMAQERFKGAD